jgi:Ca2+-binding RTX toxin-like protein
MTVQVLFLDAAIADLHALVDGLPTGLEIQLLDPGTDALAQMAACLHGRVEVDALHIVSHGAAGQLLLGEKPYDQAALLANAAILEDIGASLAADADILLYGCDIGAGEAGQAFVDTLARLTGAEVAASIDPTGPASLGGDAVLEVLMGEIEAIPVLSPQVLDDYPHLLVNHPPEVAPGDLPDQLAPEDQAFSLHVAVDKFYDPDGDPLTWWADRISYSGSKILIQPLPSWLSFAPSTHTFTGTPTNDNVGSINVRVGVRDPYGESAWDVFILTVQNVNDEPSVATPIPDQTALEDVAFGYTVPATTFVDVDAGDALTWSATLSTGGSLPAWLSFDATTRTFSGTPLNTNVGSLDVRVTVADTSAATASDTFQLTVSNANDAPTVASVIPDRSISAYAPFSSTVPDSTFSDQDGDPLTLSVTQADGSALPAWLSFDAATRTFTGAPTNLDLGSLDIEVTATDPGSLFVSDTFSLTVNANHDVVGTANDDILYGTPEADTVGGGDGADTMFGLGGNDVLDGGGGIDGVVYSGSSTGYRFGVDASGRLTVTDTDPGNGDDGTDTLIDIDQAGFADGTVSLQVYGGTRTNTYTTSAQWHPAIAALADGGYLVTWESYDQEDSGLGYGIYAQRYAPSGAAADAETHINTTAAGKQEDPVATALADGGYVLAWSGNGVGDDAGIFARRYAADGAAVTDTETRVNTTTVNLQQYPAVAALRDGGYLVTWSGNGTGDSSGIYAQRYAAGGTPTGGQICLNTTVSGMQEDPAVAALANGGYLVTWASQSQDGSGYGVYARRFAANGTAASPETLINTTVANDQGSPAAATLADGGYVVAWSGNGVGDDAGIFARRYTADGVALADTETRVNTTTTYSQASPVVVALDDGGYLVTWSGNGAGDRVGIFAQRYAASGATLGGETRVNTTTANLQQYPAAAGLDDGGYVVSWQSLTQDGDSWGIYAQRFHVNGATVELIGDGNANRLVWESEPPVILFGGDGNDTLDGGAGADSLMGGLGDDSYVVDNVDDAVREGPDPGADRVQSSVDFTLPANVEDLVLSGTADLGGTGNKLANVLTGNAGANRLAGGGGTDSLAGGAGNDVIDGGTGADSLVGGPGDDTYVVDDGFDVVSESAGGGTDLVKSSISWSLAVAGSEELENLALTGTTTISGTGNATANTITGNGAANLLRGGGGDDTLIGSGGNDTLNGGAGADTLKGGLGSDTYVVDDSGDVVTESPDALNGGIDLIKSSVTRTLGSYQENLTLTGTATINGMGNARPNTLTGNGAVNLLQGGGDSDTLIGNAGDDALAGGAGNDVLSGGPGKDIFRFDTALNATTNLDTITSFVRADDAIQLENDVVFKALTVTGTLAGDAFYKDASATAAADALDRIIYNTETGALYYDRDGLGGVAAVQFAVITGSPDGVTAADFVVT